MNNVNIDECMKIKHKKLNNNDNQLKYLKNLITRILLSIILIIGIGILIKLDTNNISLINKFFFTNNIKFTKINNWYQSNIGKVIPEMKNSNNLVFNSSELKNREYESFYNGIKLSISKGSPISLINGGIVVFIGEKDDYGNTLILQGNDGIDYWYGNITNVNVNLYDYLEKDTLIGEAKDDFLYLVLEKDGKFLSYDEYIK